MATEIPDAYKDLVSRETPALAYLAVVMQDGMPHVSPVWFDYDGTYFLINTERGRVKDRILRRKPKVALDIVDPKMSYRDLRVQGQVVGEDEEHAVEDILDLAAKYRGVRDYPLAERRVTYRIKPERIVWWTPTGQPLPPNASFGPPPTR